jgi:molybdopterin molybdotransferase
LHFSIFNFQFAILFPPTMLSPNEALNLVLQYAAPLRPWDLPVDDAWGHTLAEDIVAGVDCPPFHRSMMDGYAVKLADAGRTLPIAGEVAAGSVWEGELAAGTCLEIMTGAPCPRGTEAVVPKELVQRDADRVTLPGSIRVGQNIANPGSDCRQGQRILQAGMTFTPMAVGATVSLGITRVRVIPRPMLAIISTGGELAPRGGDEFMAPARPGQIHDSNGPMLACMARENGIKKPWRRQVPDRLEEIVHALRCMELVDIIILTGGVSVGTYDLVPKALAEYGAEEIFHGVSQKPGKPLLFARKEGQLIFGLPGNPLACHFGFHRYISAAIRILSGGPAVSDSFQGELTQPLQIKGERTHFIPGRAEYASGSPPRWQIEVLPGASSADIFRGCAANCYVEAPPGDRTMEAGELCSFTFG